ncbi:SOS response-associated peptidase family protein (plasmid) [Agrobacterium leguminum]|uniref:SOS response-associated peptidase family protein n=1 Tax=Agrobacterium leguminum TaxID=2792015 RepID=UPI002729587A|nr:SOS response-associated peptidase family protein [Agrobacterium leguminum]WLE00873.1 SOS response-associated peptidase family protein [Agrobacterium leguminum]
MSRLYAISRTAEEIVEHFGVDVSSVTNVPPETVEGTPGLIVLEKDGLRLLKSLTWGFPRQTGEMRHSGEPPGRIGLVADLTNPLWDRIIVDQRYRCLIPLTHFANPDGVKGSKTRTWFSLRRQPLMAWAGICRNTPEFGPVFAGLTMDANDRIRPLNDRMPLLLKPEEYDRWLHGSIEDVIAFQFSEPPSSDDFEVLQTRDRWQSGTPPSKASRQRGGVFI